jgi:hypothetical protein
MRRTRSLAFLLLSGLALAACEDSTVIPLSVGWLEWPAAAAPGKPFDVRIVGVTHAAIHEVRTRTRTNGDTVTIELYAFAGKCEDLCRHVFDRVIQVPAIEAPMARTIWLRAGIGRTAPQPLRTYGQVIVTDAIPMDFTMRAAGGALWRERSSGCFEIEPALDGGGSNRRFVSYDQPPDSAAFMAFIYGRIHSTQTASCGPFTASVLVIDSIR